MNVIKFGGSSVASAENIEKVASIIKHNFADKKLVVVVSALGGVTDLLLDCAGQAAAGEESYKDIFNHIESRHVDTIRKLIPEADQEALIDQIAASFMVLKDVLHGVNLLSELSPSTTDRVAGFGELLSSQIIVAALKANGLKAAFKDSRELIATDSNFINAKVNFAVTDNKIREYFGEANEDITVLPGFIASDSKGRSTTLGRGGSDYTAAIVAAALNAKKLEIWTDVSGMMTADPRLVAAAKVIPNISYQEAMELSHFGAKVIYPPTIQPVMNKGIAVAIKNTFAPDDEGTLIENSSKKDTNNIRGISSINDIVLLSLEGSGMVGIPGFSKRLFEALANEKINVIIITQSSSEHSICVGIDSKNAGIAKEAIDKAFAYEIETRIVEPLFVEVDLAIIALVGDNMKNHTGISGKVFSALGRNGINIRAIAQGSSERNITTVIAKRDVKKAVNVLHEEFFETTYKQVHLFIAGVGNVGSKLIAQIQQQQPYLQDNLRLQIKVTGLISSKKMLFNDEGINLVNWKEQLMTDGLPMQIDQLVGIIKNKNLRNTIFADVTANSDVASLYGSLLQSSISVVACNKIACSSPFTQYKNLKDLSKEYNTDFLFETNVGAGLPIISTLNDLMRSGDKVNKMQAVLSGTLNFVFNNYDGSKPFAEVVKQAQDEGYTEPDPRLDLGGTDVMRKILILAREAGQQLEMDSIANQSFMPPSCMEGSVEDFYIELAKHEDHFKSLYNQAKDAGSKLKFVATYDNGKASVGLQHIPPQHDLYHLYGKDNVVLFFTNRYVDQPLVVKGAGAGADVTASGVFADIIRTVV